MQHNQGKKILDQVGYIRIDRLWNKGDDVVKEFDLALNEIIKMEGIIFDLRQNGGGNSRIGDKIVGRFLSEPFQYGQDTFRKRLYKFAWRNTVNYFAKPRGEIYTGKLVVLTDYPVMSCAEYWWIVTEPFPLEGSLAVQQGIQSNFFYRVARLDFQPRCLPDLIEVWRRSWIFS